MGGVISRNMEKAAKKQQEFMLQTQKLQLERQIEMQNQMRIRMQAAMIARSRDLFTFVATFYGLLGIGLTAGAIKKKTPAVFFPMVPLAVFVSYFWDLAWGDKVPRILAWSEEIIEHEPHLLAAPFGMPTPDDIDKAIKARNFPSSIRN